jgi:hypothetical protein
LSRAPGTNDFHGAGFDYFRNDLLDAKDWFVNFNGLPKPAERQNDFGGPVIKNKTFSFFFLRRAAAAPAGHPANRRPGRRIATA